MQLHIECPVCYWQPDGEVHWQCTCDHRWNTFETKGICPNCKKAWETTFCPGCGHTSQHSAWYVDLGQKAKIIDSPEVSELKRRKFKLEKRLINLGIKNYRLANLDYLDCTREQFQTPFEVGCRLIILYAIAYSVHNLSKKSKLIEWLKQEKLWSKVSPNEI